MLRVLVEFQVQILLLIVFTRSHEILIFSCDA